MTEAARPGRPRDPEVEERVLEAAVTVLRQRGLEGFSFEAVAREAEVGKPALYLRWETKRALMLDALRAKAGKILVETGDIRHDLAHFVVGEIRDLVSQNAMALLRILVDATASPQDNRDLHDHVLKAFHADAQRLVDNAIKRGELPPGTRRVIFDLLYGACISHVLVTPVDAQKQMLARAEAFAYNVVDLILAGAWARYEDRPAPRSAPQKRKSTSRRGA